MIGVKASNLEIAGDCSEDCSEASGVIEELSAGTTPKHSIEVRQEAVVLTVQLPGVYSAGEVMLECTPQSIELCVDPDKYLLKVELPVSIDSESLGAQFDKGNSCIVVTAPRLMDGIQQPDQ